MRNTPLKGNLGRRFNASRDLGATGVRTEVVGRRCVRLLRSSRILGSRQAGSGSCNWHPTGAIPPQATAVDAEDAAR